MSRNNKGQFVKKDRTFWLRFTMIFAIFIPAIFWAAVFGGHEYYKMKVSQIYQEGWEVGYFNGQIDGDNTAREDIKNEFYDNLSSNPKVSYLFKKYFPEPEIAKTMRAISLSESKGKQITTYKLNKNGSWDCGFFQTNTIHRNAGTTKEDFCKEMHDLEKNFAMARKIYDERKKMFGDGFTAWSDYNNGKYLKYIK